MKISIIRLISTTTSTALLAGCPSVPSLKRYINGQEGQSVAVKREIATREGSYMHRTGWQKQTYLLSNGNWVYVEPIGADCFVHWEVNSQDIIVKGEAKGDGCKLF